MTGRAATTSAASSLDATRARLLVGAGPGPVDGLPARIRRAIAVATVVGAPPLAAFDAATAALDDEERRRRAVHVATSQARAVVVGLGALPPLALTGLGAVLDISLWRFYVSGAGVAVGALGLLLVVLGLLVSWHMVRRVGAPPRRRPAVTAVAVAVPLAVLAGVVPATVVGLGVGAGTAVWQARRGGPTPPSASGMDEVADLVATAMAGGMSAAASLRLVAEHLSEHATDLRRVALRLDLSMPSAGGRDGTPSGRPEDVGTDPLGRLVAVVRAGSAWGAPAAPALYRLAADLRASDLAHALAAAERLPALLAFPTALCLLPASVLLVGAPLVAYGLSAAGGGW